MRIKKGITVHITFRLVSALPGRSESESATQKWGSNMKKDVVVEMKTGLEARPMALFVQTANQFSSQIYLETGGKRVNVKSIMGMMSLSLPNGEHVVLDADGIDEEQAILALEKFLTQK